MIDALSDARVRRGMDMNRKGNLDIILKNMDATRATKILAKSLYKELIRNGFNNKDVINFSKEMLDHMAQEMRREATQEDAGRKDRLLIG
jgi:nickel-dependent lactate racemase